MTNPLISKGEFLEALIYVRKSHPYIEEIAKMDLSIEVDEFIEKINNMNEKQISYFASYIKNSELELVFHVMLRQVPNDLKEKLFQILKARMKKRLFHYNWIMFQGHYNNINLIQSLELLKDYLEDKYPNEIAQTLLGQLNDIGEDFLYQSLHFIKNQGITLESFFRKYQIIRNSAYANDLIAAYFSQCDREGFIDNHQFFLQWLNKPDREIIPHINHYLTTMEVLDYFDDINLFIKESYPIPEQQVFWDQIDEELKEKFEKWEKTRLLKGYFGQNHPKYLFWLGYYEEILDIQIFSEQGLLLLFLPSYTVVDIKKNANLSYLYQNAAFKYANQLYMSHREQGEDQWPLAADKIVAAKEAIIHNRSSSIYSITYERVGKLYTHEILESIVQ